MLPIPFYDPEKSYEENYKNGPYGAFANNKKFKQKEPPKHDFFGNKVFLPFGIPAGPLLNGKFVKAALDKGFDICIYKTVRSRNYPCHNWPNILSLNISSNISEDVANNGIVGHHDYKNPHSITNSFGVPSKDPDIWQKDLSDCVNYAKEGQIVVGSFQGTTSPEHDSKKYLNDYVLTARLVKETGVKAMEVNLSCPNEGHSNFLCYDILKSQKLVERIKNEIGNVPLVLKISYFHDDKRLEEFAEKVGSIADGISSINTFPAKIIDENGRQALPGEGRIVSGVCGRSIKWAGISMIKRLNKIRKKKGYKFKLEGVGGVTTPEDYFEYIKAGADSVMSATGAMWNPNLAKEIKDKI